MKRLSIILPYRASGDPHREASFAWIKSRYERTFPDSELIVCDSQDEPFDRGRSRNLGANKATGEYLLIGDADTIPYFEFVEHGLDMMHDGAPWIIAYSEEQYYNADQESSQWILGKRSNYPVNPAQITWEHKITSWAGQLLMKTLDFWEIRGYDQRFKGWGYEDNAFQLAADTILGPFERVPDAWTIHIWHPVHHEATFGQPLIDANRSLHAKYQSCSGNPEAMRKLVSGNEV